MLDYTHILNFQPTLHVMTLIEIYQFLKILFIFNIKKHNFEISDLFVLNHYFSIEIYKEFII